MLVIVFTLWRFAASPKDWEIATTKHYFGSAFAYGGWATQYVKTPHGLRTIQSEGLSNYHNLVPLAETRSPKRAASRVQGFPGTERLLVSFCISLLLRVNAPGFDVWTLFLVLNVALWLVAIWCSSRLAALYFGDGYSPVFAAMLCAVYPTFTLTFAAIKVQQLGTVFCLAACLLFESRVRGLDAWLQTLALCALFFLGFFAGGGWFFLLVALVVRALATSDPGKKGTLARILLGAAVARLSFVLLARLYDLPSVERSLGFSYAGMLAESWRWLAASATGRDVADLRLLNYAGTTFFTGFLPRVLGAFFVGHAGVLLLAGAAAWLEPRARSPVAVAASLFAAGQAGMLITGWQYHYGYLSAPAGVMTLITAAGCLGIVCARSRRARWAAVVVQALLILGFVLPEKQHADLYYGGLGWYLKDVQACYEGRLPCRTY